MKGKIPGVVGAALLVITTALWTFWGMAEMFYEGWGNPFPAPLAYLIPAVSCLLLSLVAVTWPLIGGFLLIVLGSVFTFWWFSLAIARGAGLAALLSMIPVSGMLVVTGVLFLLEARYRKRRAESGWQPPEGWVRRNFRYVAIVGVPLLVAVAVTAYSLPPLLSRLDDGERGTRVIEGNVVTLMWAPQGPGWNWRQPWGGYPSWHRIALYGVSPVGIDEEKPGYEQTPAAAVEMASTGVCRYLSADGLSLMDEAPNIWRMPTVDEIVRSLTRDGENAGCTWPGGSGRAVCREDPDKETPLWAPDEPPIYMWAADELDAAQAYYVSYNGWVGDQPKHWGNPRHGYRCVREVPEPPSSTSEAPSQASATRSRSSSEPLTPRSR